MASGSQTPPGEPFPIPSPAGALEGFLDRPANGAPPRALAVVCHPHPLYGGSAANKVVVSIARELSSALAFTCLRFNFRGVGKSPGAFDGGRGEGEDAAAAVTALAATAGARLPILLAGFSFGAWVAMRVGLADRRVAALLGAGIPVRTLDFSFLAGARKSVVVLQGDGDEFGPCSEVESLARGWPETVRVECVPGAVHFFHGRLNELRAAARRAVLGPLAVALAGAEGGK